MTKNLQMMPSHQFYPPYMPSSFQDMLRNQQNMAFMAANQPQAPRFNYGIQDSQ